MPTGSSSPTPRCSAASPEGAQALRAGESADLRVVYIVMPARSVTVDPQRYVRLEPRQRCRLESLDSDFMRRLTSNG